MNPYVSVTSSKMQKHEKNGGDKVCNSNYFDTAGPLGDEIRKNKNRVFKECNLVSKDEKIYPVFHSLQQNVCVIQNIYNLWLEEKLWDLELILGKDSIKAHKIILAAHSGYIRDIFSTEENRSFSKLPLFGVKRTIVGNIIHSLYSGNIALSGKTVDDVLSTATFLRIPSVINACSRFLLEELKVDNSLKTFQTSNLYNLTALYEDISSVICKNFETLIKKKEFLKLRYCEVLSILSRDDLSVTNELIVFDAVVSWIEADKSVRIKYSSRLMRCVRFHFISLNDLIDKIQRCSYVAKNAEVYENVQNAILYHRCSLARVVLPEPRTAFRLPSLLACGGLADKNEGAITCKVFYCNLKTGEWKHLTDLPEPRHHHAVSMLGGYFYVAGGDKECESLCPSNQVWRFDPWNYKWLEVASMNDARESFQMATLDLKLYVVGGRIAEDKAIDVVECYNPAVNKWSYLKPISSPRRHVAIASMNGFLYAVGGSNKNLISRRTERYNLQTDSWERRASIYKPRFSGALHHIKGRLYLVGGISVELGSLDAEVHEETEIEIYIPTLNQWSVLTRPSLRPIAVRSRSNGFRDPKQSYSKIMKKLSFKQTQSEPIIRKNKNPFHVEIPRTESASCCNDGKVFLIGGYSWHNKTRLNNTECIDIEELVKSNKSLKELDARKQTIQQYPLRCTGIASASIILKRIPKEIKVDKAQNKFTELTSSMPCF